MCRLQEPSITDARDETAGTDNDTPGGVYLCQVGPTVSCGACCGLYNVNELSRRSLTRMLESRTARFAQTPRTIDAIDAFAGRAFLDNGRNRPIKDFHHCPFLGLIGPEKGTVGCLLHPLAEGNHGIDWRGLSYYGAFACATYFCPACRELSPACKRLVRSAAGNWYDYGLMITETDMLTVFFYRVGDLLGRKIDEPDLKKRPRAAEPIGAFLAVKSTWPFSAPERMRPVNFFFNNREYRPPAIDFKRLGVDGSPWAPVLTALWSDLPDLPRLRAAEDHLERLAFAVAAALGE